MHRIHILFLMSLIPVLTFCQPEFKFKDKTQKFEKTKPGPLLSFDYSFTNKGNQPLIIKNIKVIPKCSCTKFEFTKEPILPGKQGLIHVTFDTNNKIGYQDRLLEVYSNVRAKPYKLRFRGAVDNKMK